jgi:uncharacterized protein YjbI with pentapeptide repeats
MIRSNVAKSRAKALLGAGRRCLNRGEELRLKRRSRMRFISIWRWRSDPHAKQTTGSDAALRSIDHRRHGFCSHVQNSVLFCGVAISRNVDMDVDPLLSKKNLELAQLELENKKLLLESQKLERDLKPESWWNKLSGKAIPLGAMVTILATVFGLISSYDKTLKDREAERTNQQRAQFEMAVKRLEDPTMLSKLVGLSILNGYTRDKDATVRRQALFTLAGFASTETDVQGIQALASFVGELVKEKGLSSADWLYLQGLLVSQSRALVEKGNLYQKRKLSQIMTATPLEVTAHQLGFLIAMIARQGLVSSNTDYASIYCADCDFTGIAFPEKTDFAAAVLDDADFSKSTLRKARFDNAELIDTRFVGADLRATHFRSTFPFDVETEVSEDETIPLGRTLYIRRTASTLDMSAVVSITMPNFSCADLTDANFDGHALFPAPVTVGRRYSKTLEENGAKRPVWYDSVPRHVKDQAEIHDPAIFLPIRVDPPNFYRARLNGAHFENVQFFSITDDLNNTYLSAETYYATAELQFIEGQIKPTLWTLADATSFDYSQMNQPVHDDQNAAVIFQTGLRAAFYLSNWDAAIMSDEMKKFLRASPPAQKEFQRIFTSPSESANPDVSCKTRGM